MQAPPGLSWALALPPTAWDHQRNEDPAFYWEHLSAATIPGGNHLVQLVREWVFHLPLNCSQLGTCNYACGRNHNVPKDLSKVYFSLSRKQAQWVTGVSLPLICFNRTRMSLTGHRGRADRPELRCSLNFLGPQTWSISELTWAMREAGLRDA